jgi:hypothetical protein
LRGGKFFGLLIADLGLLICWLAGLSRGAANRKSLRSARLLIWGEERRASIDWALNAYAMVALDWATGGWEKMAPILSDLAPRSPYLARSAMQGLYFIRHAERNRQRYLAPSRDVMAKNNDFLGPDAPAMYPWAINKIQPIAESLGLVNGNPLPNPYLLLTGVPYAEMMALKADP